MKYQAVYVGDVYEQKSGPLEVLKYHRSKKVDIKFINTGTLLTVSSQQIKKGTVEDKMGPRILGVGYHGFGPYEVSVKGKLTKQYTLWYDMLCRCYNTNLHKTKHSTYIDVEVCKEWHNFQVFAEWLGSNYVEGWTLDKDLLGGRVYSPDTCIYVPTEVNMAEAHLRKAKEYSTAFEGIYEEFVAKAIQEYKTCKLTQLCTKQLLQELSSNGQCL